MEITLLNYRAVYSTHAPRKKIHDQIIQLRSSSIFRHGKVRKLQRNLWFQVVFASERSNIKGNVDEWHQRNLVAAATELRQLARSKMFPKTSPFLEIFVHFAPFQQPSLTICWIFWRCNRNQLLEINLHLEAPGRWLMSSVVTSKQQNVSRSRRKALIRPGGPAYQMSRVPGRI